MRLTGLHRALKKCQSVEIRPQLCLMGTINRGLSMLVTFIFGSVSSPSLFESRSLLIGHRPNPNRDRAMPGSS